MEKMTKYLVKYYRGYYDENGNIAGKVMEML